MIFYFIIMYNKYGITLGATYKSFVNGNGKQDSYLHTYLGGKKEGKKKRNECGRGAVKGEMCGSILGTTVKNLIEKEYNQAPWGESH